MKRILFSLIILFFGFKTQGQWIQLNSDTAHDYSTIFFLNPDTGFICGSAYDLISFGYDGVIVELWMEAQPGTLLMYGPT